MAYNNFVVKNGLTVNGSFTANSTVVNAAAVIATSINATSVNTATANVTTSLVIGSNVNFNTSTLFVGNSSVNTSVTGGQISISGVTVNSTIYQGTANNATNLGGAAASAYVNTSASYTVAGNINFTATNNNFSSIRIENGKAIINNEYFFVANTASGGSTTLRAAELRLNAPPGITSSVTINDGTFLANSSSVNTGTITATSLRVGATATNTVITPGQIAISGVTVNSTIYQGTANNANNLNGQAASFYTNIAARLGYIPVNKAGDTVNGILTIAGGQSLTMGSTETPIYLYNASGTNQAYISTTAGGSVIIGTGTSGVAVRTTIDAAGLAVAGGITSTGGVVAPSFKVNTNQYYYMRSDNAVGMYWDGSFIVLNQSVYSAGNLSVSGTINAGGNISTSGRLYGKSPDNVTNGYALVNSQGRLGNFSWNDLGYLDLIVDGSAVGINVFTSDISLKKDIEPTTYDATKTINDIEFVSYNWKPTEYTDKDGATHTTNKGHVECGFVAQQLEQVDPGLVKTLSDGKLMPDMLNITSVLGLALQTAQKKIDALEARLTALENK